MNFTGASLSGISTDLYRMQAVIFEVRLVWKKIPLGFQ
jgi:hypothetical protein